MKKEQPNGKWIAPEIGTTLGILFGNFVLGSLLGSHTTGFVLGIFSLYILLLISIS
jgi:hypothetical protein